MTFDTCSLSSEAKYGHASMQVFPHNSPHNDFNVKYYLLFSCDGAGSKISESTPYLKFVHVKLARLLVFKFKFYISESYSCAPGRGRAHRCRTRRPPHSSPAVTVTGSGRRRRRAAVSDSDSD